MNTNLNFSYYLIRNGSVGLFILIIIFFAFVYPCDTKEELKVVKIKKGDSISYLSFKLYKKYSETIEKSLLSCNPEIKNINKIFVGQKIKFPRLSQIEQGEYLYRQKQPESKTQAEKPKIKEKTVSYATSYAYLTNIEGKVRVLPNGKSKWSHAKINQKLLEGDQVTVKKKSHAEIITQDGNILRLSENSILTISTLKNNPIKSIKTSKFSLSIGKLWNKAKALLNPKSEFSVATPTAVSGIRGTVYSIDVSSDKDTRLRTYAGSINVWNPVAKVDQPKSLNTQTMQPKPMPGPTPVKGPHPVSVTQWRNIILKKHQELFVTKEGTATKDEFDPKSDKNDPWIKWNMERDRDFENSETWL